MKKTLNTLGLVSVLIFGLSVLIAFLGAIFIDRRLFFILPFAMVLSAAIGVYGAFTRKNSAGRNFEMLGFKDVGNGWKKSAGDVELLVRYEHRGKGRTALVIESELEYPTEFQAYCGDLNNLISLTGSEEVALAAKRMFDAGIIWTAYFGHQGGFLAHTGHAVKNYFGLAHEEPRIGKAKVELKKGGFFGMIEYEDSDMRAVEEFFSALKTQGGRR